jgi:hypothetical protein
MSEHLGADFAKQTFALSSGYYDEFILISSHPSIAYFEGEVLIYLVEFKRGHQSFIICSDRGSLAGKAV